MVKVMALIKCHECLQQVSTEAKNCPSCGAPVKLRMTKQSWTALILSFVIVVGGISGLNYYKNILKPKPILSSEELRQKRLESARTNLAIAATKAIKAGLRNPDSAKWETVNVNEDGSVICVEYRAQNGFGGYSREYVTFVRNKPSESSFVWNKQCVKGKFYDLKSVANFIN